VKYFFLVYAVVAALVIGFLPMRGEKTPNTPWMLLPDMDNQDKLKAQKPDDFFADGQGARKPVQETAPVGFNPTGYRQLGGIPEPEFGGATGYYYTGEIEGFYGTGMPKELGLDEKNVGAFLRRGQEVFNVNCAICHGKSADGLGMTSNFGVPGIANLTLDNYKSGAYPDGRLFHVITNGKGNMGAYKHNVNVRDRWAVVAYVRAIQTARSAPLSDPSVKAAFEAGSKAVNVH
jgi:mono/diheme cytochrome c family protein